MNKIIIILATLIHLLPFPPNVSIVGATALYAGAFADRRVAWFVPLIPLGIGLFFSGFYNPVIMLSVFAGFALSTVAGRCFLSRRRRLANFVAAVLSGATIFYLVSNFGVWASGLYPPTFTGFVSCYFNALPFFAQSMLADAAFCFLLFGLHAYLDKPVVPALQEDRTNGADNAISTRMASE